MTRVYSLAAFAEHADGENGSVVLRVGGATPPEVAENLRRLSRLGLLTDETIWALVGRTPIDPLGVYGALKDRGTWTISAPDFAAVQVLAMNGAVPVAVMRIDLVTNEMVFLALEEGQLVVRLRIQPWETEWRLAEPDGDRAGFFAMVQRCVDYTVAAGMAPVQ